MNRAWAAEIHRLQAQIDSLDAGITQGLQWAAATYSGAAIGILVGSPALQVGESFTVSTSGLLPAGGGANVLDLTTGVGVADCTYSVAGVIEGFGLSAPSSQQGSASYSSLTVLSNDAPTHYKPNNGISTTGSDWAAVGGSLQYTGTLAVVFMRLIVTRTA
jgi:hypothetical protein